MDDKQVGELWAKYRPWSGLHGMELRAAKDVIALIHKLVEERAKAYKICDMAVVRVKANEVYIAKARDDFGIDPAEYSDSIISLQLARSGR